MSRKFNQPSKRANDAKWRDRVGVTERQAQVVVALIAAQLLGHDGATAEALTEIGVDRAAAYRACDLERSRFIQHIGFTDERYPRKIWAPTPIAYSRFGIAPLRAVQVEIETVEGRAEMMAERLAQRKKRASQAARSQRLKEAG